MIPKSVLVTTIGMADVTPKPAVSLEDMKDYLRVDADTDDALLEGMIKAATLRLEAMTNRKFATQYWDIYFDRFPYEERGEWFDGVREMPLSELYKEKRFIDLPFGPLQSVTKFSTFAQDNTETEFVASGNFYADTISPFGRIALLDGAIWPTGILRPMNGIKIRGLFGFGAGFTRDQDFRKTWLLTFSNGVPDEGGITFKWQGGLASAALAYGGTAAQLQTIIRSLDSDLATATVTGDFISGFTIVVETETDTIDPDDLTVGASTLQVANVDVDENLSYTEETIEDDGTDSLVPQDIQEAIKGLVAAMYEHRGDEMPKIPAAVQLLIAPYMRVRV